MTSRPTEGKLRTSILGASESKPPRAFLGGQKSEQHSAGGILVKKKGNRPQICLLSKRGGRVWAFPKGRVKPGESLEQTAEREILEETGHRAQALEKLDVIEYCFFLKENQTFYQKTVTFFLMSLVEEDAQPRDDEADSVGWYDVGVAKKKLSYLNEKKTLGKAENLLKYF